ncbi:MAG: hypothetical protein P8X51_16515 [Maritimibacter sp.]
MARKTHEYDPRGLIHESYAIENISAEECRAIFFDWALGRADEPDVTTQISALLSAYGEAEPEHPMTAVLREGMAGMAEPKGRRGGWRRKRE